MKIRIVKPGAQLIIIEKPGRRIRRYSLEDTIEVDTDEFRKWFENLDPLSRYIYTDAIAPIFDRWLTEKLEG